MGKQKAEIRKAEINQIKSRQIQKLKSRHAEPKNGDWMAAKGARTKIKAEISKAESRNYVSIGKPKDSKRYMGDKLFMSLTCWVMSPGAVIG